MTLWTPTPRGRPLTGRKVFWMLLGFFGVMLLANGIFVYLALTSFSGLETENAYLKGLEYNATLRRAAEQDALGWQVELEQVALEGRRRLISINYRDRYGLPLEALQVEIELRRPTNQRFDQTLALAPAAPGVYRAEVAFPLTGAWLLRGRATDLGELRHSMETRLWVE